MTTIRLLTAVLLFALAGTAHAHVAGQGFEVATEDGMLIDFGCEAMVIEPGRETMCTFGLIEQPETFNWRIAGYDETVLTVTREGKEVLSQTVKSTGNRLSYAALVLERGGPHDLTLSFRKDGVAIAEYTSPLIVEREQPWFTPERVSMAISIVFFAFIGWAFIWIPLSKRR